MTNPTDTVVYIGFTHDLQKRVWEHQNHLVSGFTHDYNCTKLIYFETGEDYEGVLSREKQLKSWTRKKKEELIAQMNPEWKDISDTLE